MSDNKDIIIVSNVINSAEVADCDICRSMSIEKFIFTFRGEQVIADRDLAAMYNVDTKRLNEAVKRNKERFPEHFCFQLTDEEFAIWKSHIATSNVYSKKELDAIKQGLRRPPYVFTEQGVSQLSAVLHSKVAIEVSIKIIDAFVEMRRFLSSNADIYNRLTNLEYHQLDSDKKIEQILNKMDETSPKTVNEQFFATGCVFDGYSFICELIRNAKKRIEIIDNYVDDSVLLMLEKRNKNVKATIHTRYNKIFLLDLDKHNKQYESIIFVQLPHSNHDRFLIVDEAVYLVGTSIKDIGKSLCAIVKLEASPEMILLSIK